MSIPAWERGRLIGPVASVRLRDGERAKAPRIMIGRLGDFATRPVMSEDPWVVLRRWLRSRRLWSNGVVPALMFVSTWDACFVRSSWKT